MAQCFHIILLRNRAQWHQVSAIYREPHSYFNVGVMHLSIVSGTVWRAGDPREIDRANSPQGQRFDRQLYPASGTIDNPREN